VITTTNAHKSLKEDLYGFVGYCFFPFKLLKHKKRSVEYNNKGIIKRIPIFVCRSKTSSNCHELGS
jgi:hypothetical protein